MKRQVNFWILLNLIKSRGVFAILGIVFTALSLFVFIPLLIILPNALTHPYQKYDFKGIEKNGIDKAAKVTSLQEIYNVTVNGQHPIIIGYEYENNGQSVSDKFETMDLDKINNLAVGSDIKVLVYEKQAMIKGLTSFTFPIQLFYLFPVLFLGFGLPALLSALIPALKTFTLYKNGIVKEAHVISVSLSQSPIGIISNQQKIVVNYYFINDYGTNIYSEATTSDLLILKDKKAGDIIKIFVSEKDENQSCLIPALEAMKNNWDISSVNLTKN